MGLSQANSERGFGRVYKQPCRRFSLSDLKLATDDFKKEYFIGRGGFGRVYKGQIDNRTTTVAIKRLHLELESGQGGNEFWTEVKMLSELRHEHLVSLIGYCNEGREMILVYEYMARGTLEDYLCKITKTGNSPLSWELRLKVCIGAASGLNSLHTHSPNVIHRDVKSSNILLDENWLAKISDFGLSKMGPASESFTHLTTNVKGTFGYLDPQYFSTGRLTIKSDVYAFGVVLFEVLCGRAAVDWRRVGVEHSLAIWACKCVRQGKVDQIIDSNLKEQILPACLNAYVEVATKCLHKDPHKRPAMAEIIKKLKFALTLQQNGVSPSSSGWWFIRCFKFQKADKSKSMVRKEAIHLIDMVAEVEACLEEQEAERSGVIRWFEGDYSFNLEDLLRASTEVLGKGTVGTSYKVMLEEGITMVVKRLKNVGVTKKQFEQQMEVLGKIKHENVVSVKAFYCSKDESFLVYDYMRTGSLSTSLHGGKGSDSHTPLAWDNRMRIALSTARGLAHLHVPGQVVHGNIKSSNVLIRQGNYEASISDFGLNALFGKSTSTSYHVAGYSAPEVLETREVTFKSDVYSFGVLLLELLTGKAPNQASLGEERISLPRWVQSVISKEWTSEVLDVELLRYNNAEEEMVQLMRIAMDCVVLVPHLRPAMQEVVRGIEEINGGETNSLIRQPSW